MAECGRAFCSIMFFVWSLLAPYLIAYHTFNAFSAWVDRPGLGWLGPAGLPRLVSRLWPSLAILAGLASCFGLLAWPASPHVLAFLVSRCLAAGPVGPGLFVFEFLGRLVPARRATNKSNKLD